MKEKPANKKSLLRFIKIAYHRKLSNRRRYLRMHLRVKVTEKITGVFEHFSSTNISAGGMFLKSERPFAVGSKLVVEFGLPNHEKTFCLQARVVRTVAPGNKGDFCAGMGVEFVELSTELRKEIDEFVKSEGVS